MASVHAFVAANRFGLGARPGDLDKIDAFGPKAWVLQQIGPNIGSNDGLAALPSTREAFDEFGAARKAEGEAARDAMKRELRRDYGVEQSAHLVASATSHRPVHERFVAFWANHFAVSIDRKQVVPVVGAFERDVIRAKIHGRFANLLIASTRHPAMLGYLDNIRSIGPHSMAGQRRGRGLNENLAREILELHTLGVDGGYAQADVESLARMLTGWSVDTGGSPQMGETPSPTAFKFHPRRHEPGEKTFLGTRYPGHGEADGLAALRKLGLHEATAHHIATKLVRHFVADDPPASAVRTVAKAFVDSGGDLPTVHRAVVSLAAAWTEPLAKLKQPRELVLATARALSYETQGPSMLAACQFLGQLPYEAPSPQGWPDRAEDWLGPEALLTRLDWIEQVGESARRIDAMALAEQLVGPVMRPATRTALAAAEGPRQLTLLLASPEFQRR
ncbi:MAG: DUF1800 domain-containing protein [Myxococcota bacterium]